MLNNESDAAPRLADLIAVSSNEIRRLLALLTGPTPDHDHIGRWSR